MKTPIINWFGLALAGLLSATAAVSRYSGIYGGSVSSGGSFIAAVTKGGHVLGLDNRTDGIRDALNPAKSTVNGDGKLKAASNSGTSVSATINPDFTIKGTIKSGGTSVRISGKRTFK